MDLSSLTTVIRERHDFKSLRATLLTSDVSKVSIMIAEPARAYLIAALYAELEMPILAVTAQPEGAKRLYEQLKVWCSSLAPLLFFPEKELFLDENLGDDQVITNERLQTLFELYGYGTYGRSNKPPIVVCSALAALGRTIVKDNFVALTNNLKVGMNIAPDILLRDWQKVGYEFDSAVEIPGVMSRRGGIVDVFPPCIDFPIRIEFNGNKIESIRLFDPQTQCSTKPITTATIIPAKEGAAITVAGSLLDYLPKATMVITDDTREMQIIMEKSLQELEEIHFAHKDRCDTPSRAEESILPWITFLSRLNEFSKQITFCTWDFSLSNESSIGDLSLVPVSSYGGKLEEFIESIREKVKVGSRTIIVSQQTQRLSELFQEKNIISQPVYDVKEVPSRGAVTLVHGSLAEGWAIKDTLSVFTDKEVFGVIKERRASRRRPVRHRHLLAGLAYGDYIVHVEHGIARFSGLEKVSFEGTERDYIVLEYAAADKLYVPADQIDRISRYIGADENPPTLSRLGTQEWVRTKKRVKEVIVKMAEELVNVYALREITPGFSFSPDNLWQQELESSFPYVETADQISAVEAVKADMEKSKPMDRLVCGDVGYGKTEVALRAAFKAIMDNKQVVLLVPTTVLAQQHLATFRGRLRAFPVRVEMLSRYCTEKEQAEVLEDIADGKIDICIGTHRLLQKDVKFQDLGLVIIDEEQRFGVIHKEHFKKLRQNIDVLTLSATPIPRTLHMSLVDIRDMSTMETPPDERLPIKTYVGFYDDKLVREAILREIRRNGQVFYVHNRVLDIDAVADKLSHLVPEVSIGIAHGQMDEKKLADVMVEFSTQKKDVLVTTTIIESGLDIPNANTLIVDHADKLGLAQLYQLRGRVGRGSNHAYALFLFNKNNTLTLEARKRLSTISEATELGAGFAIAMRDLEIRGAGNLLGVEQSGHIAAIGFDLYCQLLSEAIKELKCVYSGRNKMEPTLNTIPSVNLPVNAFIPDDYISELGTRIIYYQRLVNIKEKGQVTEIMRELNDRFGPLPDSVMELLYVMEIRLLAADANVSSIELGLNNIVLFFNNAEILAKATCLKNYSDVVEVGKKKLIINTNFGSVEWKQILREVLQQLSAGLEKTIGYKAVILG